MSVVVVVVVVAILHLNTILLGNATHVGHAVRPIPISDWSEFDR